MNQPYMRRIRSWQMRYGPSMPRRVTFGDAVHFAAERAPGALVALDQPLAIAPDAGNVLDRAAFAGLVEEATGWLRAAGAGRDSRVAIVKRNGPDVIALACAAARTGALPATISSGVEPKDLATLLRQFAPDVLVTDEGSWADRIQGRLPDMTRVLCVEGNVPGAVALDDVRGTAPPHAVRRDLSAPALVTHTSGTTAVPKLVVHSAISINGQARVQMPLGWILLRRHDTIAACLQWAHARSMALWIAVGHVRAPILALSRTDADSIARMLVRHRPKYFESLPHCMQGCEHLADHPDSPLSSVRVFMSTFDAAHPRTIRTILSGSERRLAIYIQVYAQTETGGMSVRIQTRSMAKTARGRNVGGPIRPFTRIRVVDHATHEPVRLGRPGEIEAITPGVCLGYFGADGETAGQRYGRWWRTGDLGQKDLLGRLELLDRKVDAAEGIRSTLALEDTLLDRLPQCADVVVVVDDAGRAVPVVCTHDGAGLDDAAWSRAAAGLPELGKPITVDTNDVPRTATGKVKRSVLAARIGAGL